MNKEMKLLAKKLTALFLSLTLVIGLIPGKIEAAVTKDFSYEIFDYAQTYYNGFNDNVAVATGTYIELNYGDEANYIAVEEAVAKEEGASYATEITINYSDMAEAEVVYEAGDVYLKVNYDGEEVYKEKLYTPEYVALSEMPTISLNEEVVVTDGEGKYCKQYYRIDKSSLTGQNTYKAFTIALDEDSDDETDTYMFLYDETGMLIDQNDDGDEDYVDSMLTFEVPETGERIVCVQGYEYSEVTCATLKLIAGAKKIVKFESDNAERLNVFYEGFNDDLLYATGTRIKATLDNGTVNEWVSEGYLYDYDEDDDYENGMDIIFGDVQAKIYRGDDGAVYADYSLIYDASTSATKKLFTPVIKQVSDIPTITEGTTTISTVPEEWAYSYYRITAEKDEVWNLHFSCAGDSFDYYEMGIDVYEADGTFLFNEEQEYDEDTYEVLDMDVEITVPAGTTRIIGLYDYADVSQEFTLTATKEVVDEEISKYDEVNMFTSDWNSYFGVNEGWYEGAEGELTSQSNTSWTADMKALGWGGIWGGQIYQNSTISIQEGLEYTLKCSLLSTNCDKTVFIALQSEGTYAYGKWIRLKRGVTTYINETFTAWADADFIVFGIGGEFGDREDIDDDGSIRYSFAEGGIEKYVDTDPTPATKIECKNMVLGLASEIKDIDSEEIPTTENPTTVQPTEPTTVPQTTTPVQTEKPTTSVQPTTKSAAQKKIEAFKKAGKAKIKKASKKKAAKKVKISLKKKLKGVDGYQVRFYKTKKNAKKNKKAIVKLVVKKNRKSFTVKNKRLTKKKTLYVRVRAYIKVNKKTYTGKWSSVKKVKITK